MIPIYKTKQIRELEELAQSNGISGHALMQRAGRATFDFCIKRWPQAKKIAVFCGGGNNGGDGYVFAKFAHDHGLDVTIVQVGDHSKLKSEAAAAFAECQKANLKISTDTNAQYDVLVDAICGIGLTDNLRADAKKAVEKMHEMNAPILAIDIPSGIDADTGQVLGIAARAHATITFLGLKLGLLTGYGIAYTGELSLHELGLPQELARQVKPIAEKITMDSYAHYLKPRTRDWHKGMSGHVLIVGGDLGFSGAPRMAAEAALRVGAGLVSVATRPENAPEMNLSCPEIMCQGVANPNDLKSLLARASVVVLGPGLGQTAWGKAIWQQVIELDLPLVVDADGLNFLAEMPKHKDNWVLTPHPGEAARLIKQTTADIQNDRLAAIQKIQQRYGGVCVLKGAGTLVLANDGMPGVCDKGNPGMATAGMGDVLSGVIGGLIAQGVPLGDAAKLGVYMHAVAGDMAAQEGERGLIAMDLMPFLRRLSNYSNQD